MAYRDLSEGWRAAVTQAVLAYQGGNWPAGAVVLDDKRNIMASGRNRMFETIGFAPGATVTGCVTAHAEINALTMIPTADIDKADTILSTSEPCPMCFGAINCARIRNLHFAVADPWAGSTNLASANFYLSYKKLRMWYPTDKELERVMLALNAYKIGIGESDIRARLVGRYPEAAVMAEELTALGKWETWSKDVEPGVLYDFLAERFKDAA